MSGVAGIMFLEIADGFIAATIQLTAREGARRTG
jgi:hypothetical protein